MGEKEKQPEVRVFMIIKTQVIEVDNGSEIFNRNFEYLSDALPFDEWFSDSAMKFKLEIDRAKKSLSGRIADEIFITTSFPFKDAPVKAMVGKPEYGSCWFYPIYPKIHYKSFFNPLSHQGSGYNLLYTKIDSLQPFFRWESFPRPRDQKTANDSIISQISDVTYDLKIWEAKKKIPELLICNRSDLIHPHYNLEFPLKPDTKYFWAFRARYKLNGKPQATRWAFSRHPQDIVSKYNPCKTDFIPYANYYRFITPSENR